MKKMGIASLFVAGSIAATSLVTGCDKAPGDKVLNQTEKTTTSSNGGQSTQEQKTVQHPDGTVTTEKHSDSQTHTP